MADIFFYQLITSISLRTYIIWICRQNLKFVFQNIELKSISRTPVFFRLYRLSMSDVQSRWKGGKRKWPPDFLTIYEVSNCTCKNPKWKRKLWNITDLRPLYIKKLVMCLILCMVFETFQTHMWIKQVRKCQELRLK